MVPDEVGIDEEVEATRLDHLIQSLQLAIEEVRNQAVDLARYCHSAECGEVGMNHCVDKLYEAKMWAGQAVEEIAKTFQFDPLLEAEVM